MAAAAVGTEFTIVIVVRPVAVAAIAVQHLHLLQWAAMAAVTGNVDMRSIQKKIRLQIVIKIPQVPGDWVMAAIATIQEKTLVRIVFSMTGDAISFRVGEGLRRVTILALILGVHAVQWESGQIVVEEHRVLPVDLGMTALASHARGPFVGVVLQVAGIAISIQRDFEDRLDMAVGAGRFLVPAQ